MRRTLGLLVVLLCLSPLALAQEKEQQKQDSGEKKKLKLDMSYKYDPFELHAYSRKFPQPKQLKGPIRLGEYYLAPAQDSGPGPPLRLYGTGFGTSLWRDPVTGRPIM